MTSLSRYGGIADEQLSSLDPELTEKLNIAFDNIAYDATSAQELLEKQREDLKNLENQHTQELDARQVQIDGLQQKLDDCKNLIKGADDRFNQTYSEREEFRRKFDEIVTINSELNLAIRNLENEKEIMHDQLKNKIDVIESYSNEISQLKEEAKNIRQLKLDTLIKLEDVTTREATLKVQESRWNEELSSLRRHNEWLEERLRQTSDQLSTVRRDSCKKSYCLEGELNTRTLELENSKKSIETLEESVRKLTQSNEEHLTKIKYVTEEQIKMEQLYTNEIEAQKQLITLYKEQIKEVEEKNTELTDAATNMQSLLKVAYEKLTRSESEKDILKDKLNEEQAKIASITQNFTTELEQSHQLLDRFRIDSLSEDELRQLNPSVAATLSALKRGHSLTQLYADYIQVVEDRDQLKLDKQRLTEYVEQLVDDLKEKAPVLRDQQEGYFNIQSELKELRSQYKTTSEKLGETETQLSECERRAGFYQREVTRLKRTCSDLSKQVKSLLYEVEVCRGTVISGKPEVQDVNASKGPISSSYPPLPDSSSMSAEYITDMLENIASAANVIDEHLVTWNNIDELQSQNQRLLCVARDLAGQLEKCEQNESETSKRITDLSSRLETLSGELEVVRMSAREARTQANVTSRQRDQYRALLKRHDIEVSMQDEGSPQNDDVETLIHDENNSASKGKRWPVGNTISPATVDRLEESLSSLQNEFKRYREEKLASDVVYTNTIEQLRKEYSESRLLNQKLAAQLDFTHEKLRTLETNISGYKQEITILREMNARYSTSAAMSEAELSRLRDELSQKTDRLTSVEVDARHFSRQLEAVRSNETRLKQEIDSMRQHERLHSQLMQHLEAIQKNIEHKDSMDKSSLERKIEQLEKQLDKAQSALVDASKSSQTAHETLTHELMLARESTSSITAENERLLRRVQELEDKLKDLEPVTEPSMETETSELPLTEVLKRSQTKCRELEHEIECLKSSLESSRKHADQMRQLSEQAEERLNEMIDESKQLEKRVLEDLERTKQRCEFLEAQLDLEKKERQNLVNENILTTEEAHKLNADLRLELTNLQSELDGMRVRYESAIELESGAKARIETFQQNAQEARDKYERELALHAQDVESLTEVRTELDISKSTMNELRQEVQQLKSQANGAISDLQNETELWNTERTELKRQLKQSSEEQGFLQDQIVELTQQIISLRKLTEKIDYQPESTKIGDSDTESTSMRSDIQTSEELLQVLAYMRRQKGIADAALEAASAEASRLYLRVTSLESQKEQLQNQLEEERKASEEILEKSSKHSEVMERVEQLNLVTESNRLLRHERETLREKLSDVEQQLSKLESEFGPLKEENYSLIGQKELLLCEKRSLQEERDRWKERCNRLVETAQRMDPEQYRLACNERDELQLKLLHTEEDVQQNLNKLSELRNEYDEEMVKMNSLLSESRTALSQSEQKVNELSIQENLLREDLDTKETTIVKLREIARKYRQESENLRRQISSSRSDEAQLQSTNEALIEARADLVSSRSDLSALHTQHDQLSAIISEAVHTLDELKSREIMSSMVNTYLDGLDDVDSNSVQTNCQLLLNVMRYLLPRFCTELDQLKEQSDAQKECLLRTQLIESQLTKSQRDCAELRGRLADLQAAQVHTAPSSSVGLQTNETTTPATTATSSQQDNADILHSSTSRVTTTALSYTPTATLTVSTAAAAPTAITSTTFTPHLDSASTSATESSAEIALSTSTTQPIPAWNLRAAATVQPVHPTSTVAPPSTVVGPRQTAEIKPITNNVATVIPTPAPQIVLNNTAGGLSESVPTISSTMAVSPMNSDIGVAVSTVAPFQTNDQVGAVTSFRSGFSWRTGLLNQSTVSTLPSTSASLFGAFGSFSNTTTTTPAINIGIKRRHEDVAYPFFTEPARTVSSPDDNATTSTVDSSRTPECHSSIFSATSCQNSGFSTSEAKRLRQALLSGPSSSSSLTPLSPCPTSLVKSPFVIGQLTSSSRPLAGSQEPVSTAWNAPLVTTGVAGIITASSDFGVNSETHVVTLMSPSEDQASLLVDSTVSFPHPEPSTMENIRSAHNDAEERSDYMTHNDVNEDIESTHIQLNVDPHVQSIPNVCDVEHSDPNMAQTTDSFYTDPLPIENADQLIEHTTYPSSVDAYPMTNLDESQDIGDNGDDDDDDNDNENDGIDSDGENEAEDIHSQVPSESEEQEGYAECEYEDLEQDVSETETYSEDADNNNETIEQEVIELSSGTASDSNEDQDEYELTQEGDTDNIPYSQCEENREVLSNENSPYFQQNIENEEQEETIARSSSSTDDNQEKRTSPPISEADTTEPNTELSSQAQTSVSSEKMSTTSGPDSTDVGRNTGIFSNLAGFVPNVSTMAASDTFSGFSSQFTNSTMSFVSGSGANTGLFKSFVPINPTTTSTVPSLFKPSAFSASLSAPKELVASTKECITRPKIQPIVWDSPASTSSQTVYSDNKPAPGAARRKKWGPMGNIPRSHRRPGPASGTRGGNVGPTRGGLPPRLG